MSKEAISEVSQLSKSNKSHEYKTECKQILEKIVSLQNKVFKSPDLYVQEVLKIITRYKEQYELVKENPGSNNEKFVILASFLSKVAVYYKSDMVFLIEDLMELINHFQTTLHPNLRKKIVYCLLRLRGKGLVEPFRMIVFLIKLFNCQDKDLRKIVYRYIIKDIKLCNKKNQDQSLNKQLQNFIIELLKKSGDNIAKRAIQILIELYRRNIWKDTKVVNIIAQGCFSTNYKIKLLSCYFLIETTETKFDPESSSDEEEFIQKKGKSKTVRPTKARQHRLEKEKKHAAKKQRKRQRLLNQASSFFPLDLIYSPQDFGERLFQILKKQEGEKFAVKLAVMHVISRLINRHKLIIIPFYTYIQRFLYPVSKDCAKLFSYLAESLHPNIAKEDVSPVVKHVIEQFINDRCSEQTMTMGLRAIYEMLQKHPLLLTKFEVNYLAGYSKYKNRNVSESARAVINHFKTSNPQLLERKYRGRQWKAGDELDEAPDVIIEQIPDAITGYELLQEEEEKKGNRKSDLPIYLDRVLTDDDFRRIRALQRKKEAEEEQERLQRIREAKEDDDSDGDYQDDDSQEDEDIEEEVYDHNAADADDDISEISGQDDWESQDEDEADDSEVEVDDKAKNKKRRQSISELEDSVEEFYSDQSKEEDENPHGFVHEDQILKYKKTKSEQKKELQDQMLNGTKEKWYKRGDKKKSEFASTSNKEKLKNKPLAMVRAKRVKEKNSEAALKTRIKDLKNQLGHVRSGKQAKQMKQVKVR